MAIQLTSDPIVTIQEVKDVLGMSEDSMTTVLINSVSEKFRRYTNRVQINQAAVTEIVRSYDGRLIWSHATPISDEDNVTITVYNADRTVKKTYSYTAHEIVVDLTKGRIARPNCEIFEELCGCGNEDVSFPFPSLELTYLGGWATVPGDIVMTAFEQIKVENERLKGTLGIQTEDAGNIQVDGLLKSVVDVWKKYRILI